MTKEIITGGRIGESYQRFVLDNGLTVLVYPMELKNGVFAILGAKIGSVTREFEVKGKRVRLPAGIAHFLEHKLFESENGDAFSLFAQTGAYANAYTSFDKTCYLFSSAINVEQSLRTLIEFVTHPHFTAATVEKEQGIIGQEIKMYDDNADWVLATAALQCLYSNHPVREDIAGTVESISEITPELLYECYNAFYRPQNMILSVAGGIDPETVISICEEQYRGIEFPGETVTEILCQESEEVNKTEYKRSMSVFETQFCLAYKDSVYDGEDKTKRDLAQRILLDMIAGETSELYRRLYDEGLINGMFDASGLSGEDYLCFTFSGESIDPQAVADSIKKEIARIKRDGIDADRFTEAKRAFLGNMICSFDNPESTATKMMYYQWKNIGLYDIIDTVEAIEKDYVESILKPMFDDSKCALAIIEPK